MSDLQRDKTYPTSIASTTEVPQTSSTIYFIRIPRTHDDTTWGSHFWVTLVDPQASYTLIPLFFYNYESNWGTLHALN
jgi:hypothetical protein